MVLEIMTMILILIGAVLLMCFVLSKIWDSDLSIWFITALMFITAGIIMIGTISLIVYLYYLWFGVV